MGISVSDNNKRVPSSLVSLRLEAVCVCLSLRSAEDIFTLIEPQIRTVSGGGVDRKSWDSRGQRRGERQK